MTPIAASPIHFFKTLKFLFVKLVFVRSSSYSFKRKQLSSVFGLTVIWEKKMKSGSKIEVWTW